MRDVLRGPIVGRAALVGIINRQHHGKDHLRGIRKLGFLRRRSYPPVNQGLRN